MKRKNKTAGKRLSLLLLPFIATSLCACSEKQQPQSVKLDTPFSCKAEVTKGDFSCEILISRDSEGIWQADFCAPETLSAMTVKGFGESYAIDYMGLSCTTSVTQLPAGSVVATITSSFEHAGSSDAKLKTENNRTHASGKILSGEYDLELDEDGNPISLTLGEGFVASFDDFKRE